MAEDKQHRILVAEDEADVAMICEAVLRRSGYDVVTAENGEEAWNIYQEQKKGLSLLLTDIRMPKKDGAELTRLVKKDNPNFPVVACTATHNYEAREAGADYVLEKPFKTNDLISETVEKALVEMNKRKNENGTQ